MKHADGIVKDPTGITEGPGLAQARQVEEAEARAEPGGNSAGLGVVQASLRSTLMVGAVFALATLVFGGKIAALSVGLGSVLVAADLWAIGRIVSALVSKSECRARWVLVGLAKVALVVGVLYLVIRSGLADALPLSLGLLSLPLGIVIAQFLSGRKSPGPRDRLEKAP